MTSVRTVIAGLPALADQASRLSPKALARIVRLMDEHDGYPSRGEGSGRGSSEMTSVERAAGQLLPLDRDRTHLIAALVEAHEAMHRAIKIAGKHLDKIDASTLRCTGGAGLQGALEWGRPDCDNIAEADRKGGLCSRCRHARDRWTRERSQAA